MISKEITYFGQKCTFRCDGKCNKAWGINNRPKIQLSDDDDDVLYLADDELPDAPIDPGTYEGGQAKPTQDSQKPNKWCVRECERGGLAEYPPTDYTKRVYNKPLSEAVDSELDPYSQRLGVLRVNIQCNLEWIELVTNDQFGSYLKQKRGERILIPATRYSGIINNYFSVDRKTWTVLFKQIEEAKT